MAVYPVPGTMADLILKFVQDNPDTTVNNVIVKLGLNPSPARKCLKALERHGLLIDKVDDSGHHHYRAKGARL